ncbi:MAG: sugar nucleotide-binding protein [Clostridia bacterium]|nr:sugar nucleotide-binding protein [Clostridia bacterium]
MRFLILGCNGMAGHTISLYLKERGHYVFGFGRRKSDFIDTVSGDACDKELVKDLVLSGNYDTVINCIGILNQAADNDKALATYLNSFFPHFLAKITEGTSIQVIHMSTDCVFSGKKGQYTEYDFPDGITFYDRSKALGEINDNKNITLRCSIVGPDINPKGIGLMNWFMQQNGKINGYTKAMWTGQTTLQLAKTMEYAAKTKAHGLVNAVPSSSISKCDLCGLFNREFRNNDIIICPIDGVNADKSLKRTNFEMDYTIPDYEVMIKELAEWIFNHKDLYPHYHL